MEGKRKEPASTSKPPGRRSKSSTDQTRLARGRGKSEATFPVEQAGSDLPRDYALVLKDIKTRIQRERLRVVLAANAAMVQLYWDIGKVILDRQRGAGWGAKVIDRLALDLQSAYPDMKGFSPRNLLFMRSFAAAYPDRSKVKQLVSQLPWGHVVRLLLCQSRNKIVVEYALRHLKRPIGVAEWETELVGQLPDDLKGSLPSIEEIEAELGAAREQ